MLSRPLLDRVAFFGISWYAILITGAIVIGYLLASGEARRLHLPQDTVIDFLLWDSFAPGCITSPFASMITAKICFPFSTSGKAEWPFTAA